MGIRKRVAFHLYVYLPFDEQTVLSPMDAVARTDLITASDFLIVPLVYVNLPETSVGLRSFLNLVRLLSWRALYQCRLSLLIQKCYIDPVIPKQKPYGTKGNVARLALIVLT